MNKNRSSDNDDKTLVVGFDAEFPPSVDRKSVV